MVWELIHIQLLNVAFIHQCLWTTVIKDLIRKGFKSLPLCVPFMSPLRNANPRIYCNHSCFIFL